jgi:NAD(P)-dependent dehydrogenase (short-subunit alcohol dehydrogenase family)
MENTMKFAGRSVVVTGGGGGIGRHICRLFAGEGASVLTVDKNLAAAEAICDEINRDGGRAEPLMADISQSSECDRIIETAVSIHGGVDILVNNAAVLPFGKLVELEDADWNRVVATVLSGTFFLSRAALRRMKDNSNGRIINMSSAAGLRGLSSRGAYGATKAGVDGLTRAFAIEVGPRGITVNSVAPGPVETPLVKGHSPAVRKAWLRMLAVKRYADPGEIASAILFLASPESAYLTGQTISVDGGFTAGVNLDEA